MTYREILEKLITKNIEKAVSEKLTLASDDVLLTTVYYLNYSEKILKKYFKISNDSCRWFKAKVEIHNETKSVRVYIIDGILFGKDEFIIQNIKSTDEYH